MKSGNVQKGTTRVTVHIPDELHEQLLQFKDAEPYLKTMTATINQLLAEAIMQRTKPKRKG